MESGRLTVNAKMALGLLALIGLLIISSFLGRTVQKNSALRARALVQQNANTFLIVSIKADIAESMLPAHDYLIDGEQDEEDEFLALNPKIKRKFKALEKNRTFSSADRTLIKQARAQFIRLEQIQKEIFALTPGTIEGQGAAKMEEMHVFQQEILDKLEELNTKEQKELKKFLNREEEASRRSVFLIAAAAVFALGGALIVGYLGSQV